MRKRIDVDLLENGKFEVKVGKTSVFLSQDEVARLEFVCGCALQEKMNKDGMEIYREDIYGKVYKKR